MTVVADSRFPRDGRFIERLGTYNPIANKDNIKEVTANSERVKYWVSVGAQPSDRVAHIFGKVGILPEPPKRFRTSFMLPKAERKKLAEELAAKEKADKAANAAAKAAAAIPKTAEETK